MVPQKICTYGDNEMDKPIVFFSHSSNDSNLVQPIKERLTSITGGTIDIFLSSDGQSIPLGRNWVHKIEEGLKKATIMFVFVTPNSIASNWIYFEAGFTYSKDIRVIPVGFGIDIALLKAPLNLLQGFNVTSGDSLNNFVSVINSEYSLSFSEAFFFFFFESLNSIEFGIKTYKEYSDIFQYIAYELSSRPRDRNDDDIIDDIKTFSDSILNYLNEQGIHYSKTENDTGYTILVQGVKIIYVENLHLPLRKMSFSISPYNFEQSFAMYVSLAKLSFAIEWTELDFYLLPDYAYVIADSDISAILFTNSEMFTMLKEHVGLFSLREKEIKFRIRLEYGPPTMKRAYVLGISFRPKKVKYNDILTVIDALIEKNIIYCS
jgi:hypothetical protein